ncbi:MAG TPA: Pls/PosA family non-ribosomal peptide synthetase [Arachnia sp.]|nr:Pls/PosA family non-ribosomal peptide synthetase [Arachnia sp.]
MTDVISRAQVLVDPRHDQQIRWAPGERLDHLFEAAVDRLVEQGQADRLAVDDGGQTWTYPELDAAANRLARHLAGRGVRAGDRLGLLFDRGIDGYLGMLATLKLNAAYVPLDAGFPADRLAYICHDAEVSRVLTTTRLSEALTMVEGEILALDAVVDAVAAEPGHRLEPWERQPPREDLAYAIYTSGSTGRPKGVPIEHGSICNFVRVAAEVYGIQGTDRFYQGMTIAFDFSVEEIWVPWMVGATLVPRPPGGALVGAELREFILERRITGLSCVPTLLATLEEDVPELRFLLVSGEACPQDLIARWHRPGRRFLNVYGPTEATVTATWTVLDPGRNVTIGVPLPTYSIVLLEPESDRIVEPGDVGEICIAGIALSPGYLNRPDLTAKAFIPDTHGLPNNPSGRLYRTGDLGRIDDTGEIEYLGRIDLQVKIRGYRIELTEIESVLMQVPGIATAVVEPFRPAPERLELAAYYCRRTDSGHLDAGDIRQLLRDQLPAYMVPTWFTELDAMPLLPSDKVDRKRLPAPEISHRVGADEYTPPDGPAEAGLAAILAETMGLDRASVTADFFDDLGSNSLLMARFCARVRERPALGRPVMKDVYLHRTVRTLAAAMASGERVRPDVPPAAPIAPPHRVGNVQYAAIGLAQILSFALLSCVSAFMTVTLFEWYTAADSAIQVAARSMTFSAVVMGFLFLLPLIAKWTLLGRATEQRIPVWGLGYFRFWVVRQLLGLSPIRLAAGTPLFAWYLRLLGARVGRGAVIHTNRLPPFADLLTIGPDAVVLPGAAFSCYRVESGVIRSGPVTIGAGAYVGGDGVLDIDTAIGAGAQLGHASSLMPGQRIPDGERWHGTPAIPTTDDYRTVPEVRRRPRAGVLWGLGTILLPVLVVAPVTLVVVAYLLRAFPIVGDALLSVERLPWDLWPLNVIVLGASLLLMPLSLFVRQLFVCTVPRLINLLLQPGRVYPLYGIHYWAFRTVRRLTNTSLIPLLGDSNYITGFLQRLGYSLKPVHQTGTNFGMAVRHDIPYLVRIGTGTMVSDGLSLMNAEFSATAFCVRPTVVGRDNFFGNGVLVPPDARIGDNLLLATKVLVPVSGETRHDVGLLGSPSFEIPRSVARDLTFDDLKSGPEYERRLRDKLRFNTMTIVWTLLSRWAFRVVTAVCVLWGLDLHVQYGWWPTALVVFCLPGLSVAWFAALEWASLGFRRMRPRYVSLYDPYFWRHERFWKLGSNVGAGLFNGTPLKGWVLRLQGARIGRQLFDDGSSFVERSLVTVGDYCTLNAGSIAQSHSLEDGTFKSDMITIGDGCTLAPAAFVHYGAKIGDGSVIESDAFLMKGEEVPAGQRWHGNPAMPVPSAAAAVEPRVTGAAQTRPRRALTAAEPAVQVADPLVDRLRAAPLLIPSPGVAVHTFSLSACSEKAERLGALLSRSDAAALAAISSPERRARYLASRAVVRLLLEGDEAERRSGDDPDAWWLSARPGGAPALHGPAKEPSISLSYAGDLVAIALAQDLLIGVDVSRQEDLRYESPEWVLAPAELGHLAGQINGSRDREFHRMWSLKEATAKCLGLGASLAFSQLDTVSGVRTGHDGVPVWIDSRVRLKVDAICDRAGDAYWLVTAWRPERPGRPPAMERRTGRGQLVVTR